WGTAGSTHVDDIERQAARLRARQHRKEAVVRRPAQVDGSAVRRGEYYRRFAPVGDVDDVYPAPRHRGGDGGDAVTVARPRWEDRHWAPAAVAASGGLWVCSARVNYRNVAGRVDVGDSERRIARASGRDLLGPNERPPRRAASEQRTDDDGAR